MKIVEFLDICSGLLKFLCENGLKANDYKHLDLYKEYSCMRKDKMKLDYILAILSERYSLSQSTIKRIIKRLSKEVNN